MKRAVPIFGEERHNWTPKYGGEIRSYHCSECLSRFDLECRPAGYDKPRCCPACGVIYEVSRELQAEQLARCAMALNMDPTTLLWVMQVIVASVRLGSVR